MKAFPGNGRPKYTPGMLGCALSHIFALKYAQLLDLKGILVFEDDVILSPDFKDRLSLLDQVPDDAQLIYLGAISYESKLSKKYKISENVWDAQRMGLYGGHAYIVTRNGYTPIIKEMMNFDDTVDVLMNTGAKEQRYKAYAVLPFSAYQIDGISDIDGKYKTLNYTKTLYSPDTNFNNICGYDRKTKTNLKNITSDYSYEKKTNTKQLF
jgi:GR25 family glycosyltransferase involved in LPS biosynthesis